MIYLPKIRMSQVTPVTLTVVNFGIAASYFNRGHRRAALIQSGLTCGMYIIPQPYDCAITALAIVVLGIHHKTHPSSLKKALENHDFRAIERFGKNGQIKGQPLLSLMEHSESSCNSYDGILNIFKDFGNRELKSNAKKTFELLIRHGAEIQGSQDTEGNDPLAALSCALSGQINESALVILAHPSLNLNKKMPLSGRFPLELALVLGNEELALAMLNYNIDLEAELFEQNTYFSYAVLKRMPRVYKKLLDLGANPNITTELYTPLHCLAQIGDHELLQTVLGPKYKVAVDKLDPVHRQTPLHFAARANQPDCIEVLLDHGAKIDFLDDRGQSPLHYAAQYGNLEATRLLIEKNANCSLKNEDGKSLAVMGFNESFYPRTNEKHENLALFLLERQIPIEIEDLRSVTIKAFSLFLFANWSIEIWRKLMELNPDLLSIFNEEKILHKLLYKYSKENKVAVRNFPTQFMEIIEFFVEKIGREAVGGLLQMKAPDDVHNPTEKTILEIIKELPASDHIEHTFTIIHLERLEELSHVGLGSKAKKA